MTHLWFWQFDADDDDHDLGSIFQAAIIERTGVKMAPAVYFNAEQEGEYAYIARIDKRVGHLDPMALLNVDEHLMGKVNDPARYDPAAVEQVVMDAVVMKEQRPNVPAPNYGLFQLPFNDPTNETARAFMKRGSDGHRVLRQLQTGMSLFAYDPYDDDTMPRWTEDKQTLYIEQSLGWMKEMTSPHEPRVLNMWHRHSRGPQHMQRIDHDEFWKHVLQVLEWNAANPTYQVDIALWGLDDMYWYSTAHPAFMAVEGETLEAHRYPELYLLQKSYIFANWLGQKVRAFENRPLGV